MDYLSCPAPQSLERAIREAISPAYVEVWPLSQYWAISSLSWLAVTNSLAKGTYHEQTPSRRPFNLSKCLDSSTSIKQQQIQNKYYFLSSLWFSLWLFCVLLLLGDCNCCHCCCHCHHHQHHQTRSIDYSPDMYDITQSVNNIMLKRPFEQYRKVQ